MKSKNLSHAAECCSTSSDTTSHHSKPTACCGGEHDHEHDTGDNPRMERNILVISCALYALAFLTENCLAPSLNALAGNGGALLLYAIPYILCGWPVFASAFRAMRNGNILNEFTLMGGATLVALALKLPAEAAGVMLFYRVGEYFQESAAASSRTSITSLLASKPETATVLENGQTTLYSVEHVSPEQVVLVRPGERIPLDGEVLSGQSQVDQSPLTGESMPVAVETGSTVMGGCVNLDGTLTVRVTSAFADTHMARVLYLVEEAATRKAPTERFISRFARYYTPVVVAMALCVAVIPPLVSGADWSKWIYQALIMLVVSCPCALVISIPLSYFAGIGAASRSGILVKGGAVFDAMEHIETVVFDKTGTLTHGVFAVTGVHPAPGVSHQEVLTAAAIAEHGSNHPIAKSIMREAGPELVPTAFVSNQEIPGKGIAAQCGQVLYLAGTSALLDTYGVEAPMEPHRGTAVYIAENNRYLGCITVADTIRKEAKNTISLLKARGLKTLMLSGDKQDSAAAVAMETGVDTFRAELLPEDKVRFISELADKDRTAFVGDGINDAPALALSRVGIALGGIGAEAAVEAADVVILDDSPAKVETLFTITGAVRRIVRQNIIMALGIKAAFLCFGAMGLSNLWEAIFADVGVALLAVLNASRILRK